MVRCLERHGKLQVMLKLPTLGERSVEHKLQNPCNTLLRHLKDPVSISLALE